MIHRDPVHSLAHALHQALWHDLLMQHGPGAPPRRPREQDCSIVLFGQVWSAGALGVSDSTQAGHHELDTVVIVGPAQDACVYAGRHLVCHVLHPNRRFYLDVAAQCMAPAEEAACYEGRDDGVTESIDIELAAALARLQVQVKRLEPQRASLVARYLRQCAERFDSVVPHSLRLAWGGVDRRRA
jgi:hypothetical protein